MTRHRTIRVEFEDIAVDVDEKLAPLMPLLWRHGISTDECCQEERPGFASITFPGTDEIHTFLSIAEREYKAEVETRSEAEPGEYLFSVRLFVLFPVKDIPHLVAKFKAAIENA